MSTNKNKQEYILQKYSDSLNELKIYLEKGDIKTISESLKLNTRTVYTYLNNKGKSLGIMIRINNSITNILANRSINVD